MRLEEDLTFSLYHERRNSSMFKAVQVALDNSHYTQADAAPIDVTLPAQTMLVVDRVYIRQDAKAFDSISFYIQDSSDPAFAPSRTRKGGSAKGRKRFWMKLADLNGVEVTMCPDTTPGLSGEPLVVRPFADLGWGEKDSYEVGEYVKLSGYVSKCGAARVSAKAGDGTYVLHFAIADDGRANNQWSPSGYQTDMKPATEAQFLKDVKKFQNLYKRSRKDAFNVMDEIINGKSPRDVYLGAVTNAVHDGFMTQEEVGAHFAAAGQSTPRALTPRTGLFATFWR